MPLFLSSQIRWEVVTMKYSALYSRFCSFVLVLTMTFFSVVPPVQAEGPETFGGSQATNPGIRPEDIKPSGSGLIIPTGTESLQDNPLSRSPAAPVGKDFISLNAAAQDDPAQKKIGVTIENQNGKPVANVHYYNQKIAATLKAVEDSSDPHAGMWKVSAVSSSTTYEFYVKGDKNNVVDIKEFTISSSSNYGIVYQSSNSTTYSYDDRGLLTEMVSTGKYAYPGNAVSSTSKTFNLYHDSRTLRISESKSSTVILGRETSSWSQTFYTDDAKNPSTISIGRNSNGNYMGTNAAGIRGDTSYVSYNGNEKTVKNGQTFFVREYGYKNGNFKVEPLNSFQDAQAFAKGTVDVITKTLYKGALNYAQALISVEYVMETDANGIRNAVAKRVDDQRTGVARQKRISYIVDGMKFNIEDASIEYFIKMQAVPFKRSQEVTFTTASGPVDLYMDYGQQRKYDTVSGAKGSSVEGYGLFGYRYVNDPAAGWGQETFQADGLYTISIKGEIFGLTYSPDGILTAKRIQKEDLTKVKEAELAKAKTEIENALSAQNRLKKQAFEIEAILAEFRNGAGNGIEGLASSRAAILEILENSGGLLDEESLRMAKGFIESADAFLGAAQQKIADHETALKAALEAVSGIQAKISDYLERMEKYKQAVSGAATAAELQNIIAGRPSLTIPEVVIPASSLLNEIEKYRTLGEEIAERLNDKILAARAVQSAKAELTERLSLSADQAASIQVAGIQKTEGSPCWSEYSQVCTAVYMKGYNVQLSFAGIEFQYRLGSINPLHAAVGQSMEHARENFDIAYESMILRSAAALTLNNMYYGWNGVSDHKFGVRIASADKNMYSPELDYFVSQYEGPLFVKVFRAQRLMEERNIPEGSRIEFVYNDDDATTSEYGALVAARIHHADGSVSEVKLGASIGPKEILYRSLQAAIAVMQKEGHDTSSLTLSMVGVTDIACITTPCPKMLTFTLRTDEQLFNVSVSILTDMNLHSEYSASILSIESLMRATYPPLTVINSFVRYPYSSNLADAPSTITHVLSVDKREGFGVLAFAREGLDIGQQMFDGKTSEELDICKDQNKVFCVNIVVENSPQDVYKPDFHNIFHQHHGAIVKVSSGDLIRAELSFGGYTLPEYQAKYVLVKGFPAEEMTSEQKALYEKFMREKDAAALAARHVADYLLLDDAAMLKEESRREDLVLVWKDVNPDISARWFFSFNVEAEQGNDVIFGWGEGMYQAHVTVYKNGELTVEFLSVQAAAEYHRIQAKKLYEKTAASVSGHLAALEKQRELIKAMAEISGSEGDAIQQLIPSVKELLVGIQVLAEDNPELGIEELAKKAALLYESIYQDTASEQTAYSRFMAIQAVIREVSVLMTDLVAANNSGLEKLEHSLGILLNAEDKDVRVHYREFQIQAESLPVENPGILSGLDFNYDAVIDPNDAEAIRHYAAKVRAVIGGVHSEIKELYNSALELIEKNRRPVNVTGQLIRQDGPGFLQRPAFQIKNQLDGMVYTIDGGSDDPAAEILGLLSDLGMEVQLTIGNPTRLEGTILYHALKVFGFDVKGLKAEESKASGLLEAVNMGPIAGVFVIKSGEEYVRLIAANPNVEAFMKENVGRQINVTGLKLSSPGAQTILLVSSIQLVENMVQDEFDAEGRLIKRVVTHPDNTQTVTKLDWAGDEGVIYRPDGSSENFHSLTGISSLIMAPAHVIAAMIAGRTEILTYQRPHSFHEEKITVYGYKGKRPSIGTPAEETGTNWAVVKVEAENIHEFVKMELVLVNPDGTEKVIPMYGENGVFKAGIQELKAGTEYLYVIRAVNPQGIALAMVKDSFKTAFRPEIGVPYESIGIRSADIKVETRHLRGAKVELALISPDGTQKIYAMSSENAAGGVYFVKIEDLNPDTDYKYEIRAVDPSGTIIARVEDGFRTKAQPEVRITSVDRGFEGVTVNFKAPEGTLVNWVEVFANVNGQYVKIGEGFPGGAGEKSEMIRFSRNIPITETADGGEPIVVKVSSYDGEKVESANLIAAAKIESRSDIAYNEKTQVKYERDMANPGSVYLKWIPLKAGNDQAPKIWQVLVRYGDKEISFWPTDNSEMVDLGQLGGKKFIVQVVPYFGNLPEEGGIEGMWSDDLVIEI